MKKLKLSYSAISSYKACPIRFRNAYVLGIRPMAETESQRIGTNWHEILEIASLEPGSECKCKPQMSTIGREGRSGFIITPHCPICGNTGKVPEDIMDAVVRVLNKRYENVPPNMKSAMELERTRLLYSLIGYRWYYGGGNEPAIAREIYFSIPLINPETKNPVPNVLIEGKIDKLVHMERGEVGVKEHKSTGSSIDNDSTYWSHLSLDTQTNLYIYAVRRLQLAGSLIEFGLNPDDSLTSMISYDVYHKPQTTPKLLTQADSKKFVENGEYCGQKFDITTGPFEKEGFDGGVVVGGEIAGIELGKKEGTFAIRETSEMYGARLLQDIVQRPQFYFNCKELGRTDLEMKAFEYELYDIAKDIMSKIRADRWYHDESQCEATFKCDYCDSCYNHIELDPNNPPEGMKCIFNKEKSND